MTVAPALRALLDNSIDYAGMFPPCSLDLETAGSNYAAYCRSDERRMLGAFVLSLDQFEAAKALLPRFDHSHRLRISALGPKTNEAAGFCDALPKVAAGLRSMMKEQIVSIDQLEMFLPDGVGLPDLEQAKSVLGDLPAFFEAPAARAEQAISLIAAFNATAGRSSFGFKCRTGGVTADAFPTPTELAQVLASAARHQTPIKFTAGLHHPIRQYRDEIKTKMYGFLNVLGAAVLTSHHHWDEKQTASMLADENPKSFSFEENYFSWREWKIDSEEVKAARRLVVSFGSCSFDEPCEDLRALNLL